MSAQVKLQVLHGDPVGNLSTNAQDAGTIRMKTADDDNLDNINPLVKPTSALQPNFSFEKVFRLWVTAAPAYSLGNLRFHRSGADLSDGIEDRYGVSSTYRKPIGTESDIATLGVPTSATQINGVASVSSNNVQFGPFFYIQWRVSSNAVAGVQNTTTYRWTFDES